MSTSRHLPILKAQDRTPVEQRLDEYQAVIDAYGQPDSQLSTEYGNPRPALVIRTSRFVAEGVKIIFVPIGRFQQAPPYPGWLVFAYADNETGKPISREEAERRLATRERRSARPRAE